MKKHLPNLHTVILIITLTFFSATVLSQVKKAPVKKASKPVSTNKTVAGAKKNTSTVTKNTAVKNNSVSKPTGVKSTTPIKPDVVAKANPKTIPLPVKPAATATPVMPQVPLTLTTREQQMINEINILRAKPADYCNYIDSYLEKNDVDENARNAAKELKGILKKMKPLNPLTINLMMYRDAKNFGMMLAKNNSFEHSDLPYAENLSLGYENIRDAIIDLLIDDDVPDRAHRKNLLSDKYQTVAVVEVPGKIQDIAYCYVQEFK